MNEIHDCRKCKNYGNDYDCRENCEGRDMFEPIKKSRVHSEIDDYVIEELEKINAEVCEPNEMEYFENSNVWQKWFCDLINKHISELKGE